ncbi:MAG: hypothetical protein KatS3mg081_2043 [Gemmatimonadales bacterium]|nr:MAG: hypothetical protein KatS3mg081_2043 [Gemmatimonadales bacterium]
MEDGARFVNSWQDEPPRFRRGLEMLPTGHLDFRPHEPSRSGRELACTVVQVASLPPEFLRTGTVIWEPDTPPGSVDAIRSLYDQASRTVAAELSRGDKDPWEGRIGRLRSRGQLVWEAPFHGLAWGYLFDPIHHRGQLSLYIRPMGGRVPPIYGPAGDFPNS